MHEIQGVHLEASRNAAHYELLHTILEFALACQAVTRNMQAVLQPFKAAVEEEGRLLGISLRSEKTEQLDITDRERDGIISAGKALANALTKNPNKTVADAAAQLNNEFISLKVDTQANYMQQTGQIDILLATLTGSYTQQLEICGLTKAMEFLKDANDRMHALMNERSAELAPRVGTAMTDARTQSDQTYRAFIKFYNAWILVNAAQLAQDDQGTTTFSTVTNQKIDYFKRYVLKETNTTKPGELLPGEGDNTTTNPPAGGDDNTNGGNTNNPGAGDNTNGGNTNNPGAGDNTNGGNTNNPDPDDDPDALKPGNGGDDPDL